MSNTTKYMFISRLEANRAVYELYKEGMAYGLEKRLYRAPELFSEEVRAKLLSVDGREVELPDGSLMYQTVDAFNFNKTSIKALKGGKER